MCEVFVEDFTSSVGSSGLEVENHRQEIRKYCVIFQPYLLNERNVSTINHVCRCAFCDMGLHAHYNAWGGGGCDGATHTHTTGVKINLSLKA